MFAVGIRYWAAARDAAATETEIIPAESVQGALATARERRGAEFAKVLAISSVLIEGRRAGAEKLAEQLSEPVEIEVLPPFAGG